MSEVLDRPSRKVRLFRNGRNQALRIPKEFEFPSQDAVLRRVGDSLILEPAPKQFATLEEAMRDWEPLDIEIPDVDAGLPPLDDIVL